MYINTDEAIRGWNGRKHRADVEGPKKHEQIAWGQQLLVFSDGDPFISGWNNMQPAAVDGLMQYVFSALYQFMQE